MILATLFFNLFFWDYPAEHFCFNGSPTGYIVSLAAAMAFVLTLFFLGPALAAHKTRRSLFHVVEASFGKVPAIAFRIGCAALCILWIVGIAAVSSLFVRYLLQRSLSRVELGLFAIFSILFLLATGLQSLRTSAKLAFFSNKLGLALLIAAAIRVSRYLPDAWDDMGLAISDANHVWLHIAAPLVVIGPMALLAADFGYRTHTRKDVVLIGTFGLALPMGLILFLTSLIQRAASHWYPYSGYPANMNVALWGADSEHYRPQWVALALVTLFGFARFFVFMLRATVAPLVPKRKSWLVVLGAVVLAGATLSVIADQTPILTRNLELAARLAACIAAILSADYLVGRWIIRRTRTVDWPALLFVIVGCTAGGPMSFWQVDYEAHIVGSILLTYAASFVSCLVGRAIEVRVTVISSGTPVADA
jgi:hypothetical protein